MANLPDPVPPEEPTTFRALFDGMDDAYQGVYLPMLQEYQANDQVLAPAIMQNTVAHWPVDQVPALFLFQDPLGTIRIIHHPHQVAAPIGQPPTPLTDLYLGFSGEIVHGQAQILQLPELSFFSNTGEVTAPTYATLTAQLVSAADGFVGPYNPGDPDTEQVNTRRAVPVPLAYIPLVTFRILTPQQAWQQIGEQILLDGREADCPVLLDFLRVTSHMAYLSPVNYKRSFPHSMVLCWSILIASTDNYSQPLSNNQPTPAVYPWLRRLLW